MKSGYGSERYKIFLIKKFRNRFHKKNIRLRDEHCKKKNYTQRMHWKFLEFLKLVCIKF